PDKFRDTASAAEVAAAIVAAATRAGWDADAVPLADGGEGTLDALVAALDGRTERTRVSGPLGDLVDAPYGIAETDRGRMAIVEMARASGLGLVSEERRRPRRATTYGTGQLIVEACRHRPDRLIVCIGGSATTDGGAGMAQALGIGLRDEDGRPIPPGGAGLRRLATIDVRGLAPEVKGVEVVVASDVDNPLVGPQGAAAVFGPQKGASPEDVRVLEVALAHYAAVLHRDLGLDLRHEAGAGAAGGLGAGLIAFLGARMRRGFEVVAEAVGLAERLARADVAVTGEGKWDRQTERGKAPAGVLRLAREARCRTVLMCGQVEGDPDADLVYDLSDSGLDQAMGRPRELLREAAQDAARSLRG
ncbi:MAG TPA: glycerate kinase, partial [Actinomycetota bacterium]|nr:glycerate kinase [Actinomycetota bacterium]